MNIIQVISQHLPAYLRDTQKKFDLKRDSDVSVVIEEYILGWLEEKGYKVIKEGSLEPSTN